MIRVSRASAALTVATAILPILLAGSVRANVLKKHPTAAGIGAGLIAHHMAKNAAAHGSHNIMARHPMATGIIAGAIVRHHLKKKH